MGVNPTTSPQAGRSSTDGYRSQNSVGTRTGATNQEDAGSDEGGDVLTGLVEPRNGETFQRDVGGRSCASIEEEKGWIGRLRHWLGCNFYGPIHVIILLLLIKYYSIVVVVCQQRVYSKKFKWLGRLDYGRKGGRDGTAGDVYRREGTAWNARGAQDLYEQVHVELCLSAMDVHRGS